MACKGCGEADGHHKPGCGFSPTVLQITNKDCTLFHNVTIPAIMGDETEVPPTNGLYKNVLLYYEASGNAYFYSSDGIPTKLTYATTDYNVLTNKPTINGVTLEGNQSSSSLGININDATLTLKQGDTTLGTFSANANEDVEINVPGGSEPISFTVSYNTTIQRWTDTDAGLLVGEQGMDGDTYPKSFERIQTFVVPGASFTNGKTGEVLGAEGLYNLLETGADVVLNNVPIGERLTNSDGTKTFLISGITCDGVKLTKVGPYHEEERDSGTGDLVYSMDKTAYSATVSANSTNLVNKPIFVPLAIHVYKTVTLDTEVSDEPQTEYGFETQGTYHYLETHAPA